MEDVKVGNVEKKAVGSVYRLLQRLNPFTHYYESVITQRVKKCSNENYLNFDGHFHDIFSDGDSTPEHMLDVCHRRNIKVASADNHNTVEHWNYYQEAEKNYPDLVYIPGIEVSTQSGDIIAWFPSYRCKDFKNAKALTEEKRLSTEEAIAKIHRAGGVAIAPHPNKYRGIGLRELKILEEEDRIDGVEEINTEAGEYNLLGKRFRLPSFGNSDAHSKINVGSAFSKIPKEYFKDCYEESGRIDKDKFRQKLIEMVRDEKVIIRGMESPSRIIPCLAVKSSFEENIGKTTYANPFSVMLKLTEYFFDKNKVVAKRLASCLKKDPEE